MEDQITNQYYKIKDGQKIEITEYQVEGTDIKRYSVKYKYKGVEYFLIGTLNKQEIELIVKNLYFL